jgi:hypothetical protein
VASHVCRVLGWGRRGDYGERRDWTGIGWRVTRLHGGILLRGMRGNVVRVALLNATGVRCFESLARSEVGKKDGLGDGGEGYAKMN